MTSLLDVLDRAGVPRASARSRWPVDVVTQVLRDHEETFLPVRSGMDGHAARRMRTILTKKQTGGWWYETKTEGSPKEGYTVWAKATRFREGKFVKAKPGPRSHKKPGEDELFTYLETNQDTTEEGKYHNG